MELNPARLSHQQAAIIRAEVKARHRALVILAVLVRRIGQIVVLRLHRTGLGWDENAGKRIAAGLS